MLDTRAVIEKILGEAAFGDLHGVMRWWAPGGILEDVTMARAFRGHDEIRSYLDMYYRALPQLTYEPVRMAVDGPTAVVEWARETVVAAPFDGIPHSAGRTVFLHAVDIFHVSGGLVQHESSWYGDGWLRQRLGDSADRPPPPLPLTPPPGPAGSRF
jgi:hypothetical protein